MNFFIDNINKSDFQIIINLNQQFIPAVSNLNVEDMILFEKEADYFKVLKHDEKIIGFLIAILPNKNYESINYLWFNNYFNSFIYIDRICISLENQNKGYGFYFYKDLLNNYKNIVKRITCEVNIFPENIVSNNFHQKFGFTEVGRQTTSKNKKLVSLKEYKIPNKLYSTGGI